MPPADTEHSFDTLAARTDSVPQRHAAEDGTTDGTGGNAGGTVYTRANGVASQDGMVGAPYDALKQACFGAQKDRLLLLQYET